MMVLSVLYLLVGLLLGHLYIRGRALAKENNRKTDALAAMLTTKEQLHQQLDLCYKAAKAPLPEHVSATDPRYTVVYREILRLRQLRESYKELAKQYNVPGYEIKRLEHDVENHVRHACCTLTLIPVTATGTSLEVTLHGDIPIRTYAATALTHTMNQLYWRYGTYAVAEALSLSNLKVHQLRNGSYTCDLQEVRRLARNAGLEVE